MSQKDEDEMFCLFSTKKKRLCPYELNNLIALKDNILEFFSLCRSLVLGFHFTTK